MARRITISDLGYTPGQLPAGPKKSILDVPGVHVGQVTIGKDGEDICKGVTVILPRHPDEISIPCYAGLHTFNGNGEMSGSFQIRDWGFTNTPLALTNSLSFGNVFQGVWEWTLKRVQEKGMSLDDMGHNYGSPVVAETADWWLNDVFKSALSTDNVHDAFAAALTQTEVLEGQNGGGAGMTCHMFPGGTGTSSRVVKGEAKDYTVGVLVQTNYGHNYDLQIAGLPLGKADDGSIVVFCITDAPMLPHQLNRMARHCAVGLAQVGGHGVGRNFSGDIILALSTANKPNERVLSGQAYGIAKVETNQIGIIKNESIDTLFRAASEVTEEAILNSIIAGRDGRTGVKGRELPGLPIERAKELLAKYRVVV
ncbi:peptidase family S58-domain-containing protein [Amylocarpus encephaloides]|uniref:Peptidase family S58-domain-containing protein n=1 Tax=Amylocarpus encephaloides TaxID=45428 RepID=A0A9P7YNJ0_9HELO|nr:peptidase family S58-domain-containing protein [Amylocarpus encephaloides]